MSSPAALTAPAASSSQDLADDACALPPPARPQRAERSVGKGRRRRAVAEQRRAEQQRWSNFGDGGDDEIYVAPPRAPASRRQLRRSARRIREHWEVSFEDELDDNLDIALALSLSLSETGAAGTQAENHLSLLESHPVDMSYESLVMLENVKCTATPYFVSQMMGHVFEKEVNCSRSNYVEELCTICQVEYRDKDSYMLLPCSHTLHEVCGSEWFLNHSKLCPVCKHDITEKL